MKPPYIFGASIAGPFHIKGGIPCQDAFFYDMTGNIGIIAVADGLGSAPLSDKGAFIAVNSAVEYAKQTINPGSDYEHLYDVAVNMPCAARRRLQEVASTEGIDISDMATTLITVLFGPDFVFAAQIGDGAVVGLVNGAIKILSVSPDSEYTNEVMPITDEDWWQLFRCSETRSAVQALAVFTDGCQRASLIKRSDCYEPFDRFFHPVFSFAASIDDIAKAERELEGFLNSPKMGEFSDDDKTMVLAILEGITNE